MRIVKLVFDNKKVLKLIVISVFLLFTHYAQSQTVLLNEGFETDGEGTRYDSTWIEDGNNYFQRRPITDFTGLSNSTGSGLLAARKVNDSEPQNPAHPVAVFRTKSINISGYDNLTLNMDIGANIAVFNLNLDSVVIYYAIDADITSSSFTKIGAFHPAMTGESDLVEDDDLDGSPGPSTNTLSGALANYSYSIPSNGDNLMIRILLVTTSNNEIVVFDELTVTGTPILALNGLTPANGSLTNDLSTVTLQYDQAIMAASSGTISISGPTNTSRDIAADLADFDFSTANEVTIDLSATTFTNGMYTVDVDAGIFEGTASEPNLAIDGTTQWSFNLDATPPAAPVISIITDDTGTSNSDRITNDQTLVISGTAEANSTVSLTLVGTGILDNSIVVDGSGDWSFDYTGTTLPQGNYTFTATAMDAAGNNSLASANFNIEVDTSISIPVITGITDDTGDSSTDQITNDQTLIITGTADPNTIVTLNLTGTGVLSSTIPVNGAGNWTFDYTGTTLAAGNYSFTASGLDIAGNTSGNSSNFDIVIDNSANAPLITGISNDNGSSNSDAVTNDQTLVISGTAEANSTLTLTRTGTGILSSTIPVNGSGNWSFDYTGTTLPGGNFIFTASVVDQAGNASGNSPNFNVTIDIGSPATPTIIGITTDSGSSTSDQITNDQTLIISGTAEANSVITLTIAGTGVISNSINVNGAGVWSFDYTGTTLPAGSYVFTAFTTDIAGNTSPVTANFNVEVDTNINAPVIASITDDTGISGTDEITSDQTLIISGTAEANSTVTLTQVGTGVLSGAIAVNGAGNWSFDYTATTLPTGSYTFRATATDIAGNTSANSANFLVEIDNSINVPAITSITNDNGLSNTDGITNDQTLTLSGTAEANSTVTLRLVGTGVLSNTIVTNGSGNWTFDYTGTTLPSGNYIFRAAATDLAGNVSGNSPDFNVEIDITSPSIPSITGITNDTGISATDEITNDQTLILSGTAPVNTRITLSLTGTGVLSSSIPVNGAGNWTFDYTSVSLPQGTSTFTATATDVAGNSSGSSPGFNVEIDLIANAPIITAITDDTGVSGNDEITNDQNLIISGTAEANSTVTLSLAGTGILSNTIAVNGAGNWSFDYTGTTLPAGIYTFNAAITDRAGNVSSNSANFVVEIDITAPSAPLLISITDDTGVSANDENTNDQNLVISGSSDLNTIITLSRSGVGVLNSSISVNGSGNWSFDYSATTLADGVYTFTAFATDIAGNTGPTSTNFTVTIDTASPTLFSTGNVTATTGTIRSNFWNATNTGLNVIIPIANDASLSGGTIQVLASVNNGSFMNLGSPVSIGAGNLGNNQTVSINGSTFEAFNGGLIDTDAVEFNAIITDIAGNSTTGNQSPNVLTIDQTAPIIRDNEISLDPNDAGPEIITFTISETLALADNTSVSGFSTSSGTIANAIYSSRGVLNLITLTSSANADWNQSTTVDYSAAPGNILDIAGNELVGFAGQTVEINVVNLSPGDIAFTSYRSDNPDAFSFVLLKDIFSNTEINFTDNGYRSDGAFSSDSGDRTITWRSDENLFAGTEIVVTGLSASRGSIIGSDPLQHGNGGDQILAYQGSNSQPTFITAINWNGTDWVTTLTTNSESRSVLPPGLIDAVTAIRMNDDDEDNGAYRFATEITAGTVAALRTSLMDNTLWNLSDNPSSVSFPSAGDNYTLPPNRESTTPANGERIASDFSSFQIDFDENISKSASFGGEITFIESGVGPIATLDISSSSITTNNDLVNINISSILPLLSDETTYEVNVDGFLFVNADNNHNDSIVGSSDWTFIYDETPPQVSSIVRKSGSTNPEIDDNGVTFTVTFDDDVTGVDVTDFVLSGNASAIANISSVTNISSSVYDVEVNGIDLNNNLFSGTLRLDLDDNNSILDNALNPLGGNGNQDFTTGESFTIIHPVPAAHVGSFAVNTPATTSESITLQWTESTVEQLPNRYLILVREASSTFIPVTNGVLYNDIDFSDGSGAFNINRGSTSAQINGLVSGTQYFFRIIPHSNDGANTLYRTTASIPEINATTLVAQLSTIDFLSAASTISATVNALSDIAGLDANLSFSITDDGGITPDPDNAPTLINQIVVSQGVGNDINLTNWTTVIAGAELRDIDNNVVMGTINASNITFNLANGDEEIGEIDDDETKEYTLRLWLNSNLGSLQDVIDGLNFEFTVSETDITTETLGSSRFATGEIASSGANNNEVEVNASDFIFVQNPATLEGVNVALVNSLTTPPIVEARDTNNNLDLDFSQDGGRFNLSAVDMTLSGVPNQFTQGTLNLMNMRYNAPGDGMLTIIDPSGQVTNPLNQNSSTAVDVIGTIARQLTAGIRDNLNGLEAGSINIPILGFELQSSTRTPSEPVLNELTIRFSPSTTPFDIANVFENIRVFRSFDSDIDPTFVNTTNITVGITQGSDFVTFTGLNEILDNDVAEQNFFIVVDIRPGANAFQPSVVPFFDPTETLLSSGSIFSNTGNSINGLNYNFVDRSSPQIVSLVPSDDNITVGVNTTLQITFDEPVTFLGTSILLRQQINPAFQENIPLTNVSADNRTFTFTPPVQVPALLQPEMNYYVNIEIGDRNANTGFVDNSDNGFPGISNTTTWNFRTADTTPPNLSAITVNDINDQGFNFSFQLDEPGEVFYVVADHTSGGFVAPSPNQVFNQSFPGSLASGIVNVLLPNQDHIVTVSGLSNNQDFTIYAIAEDAGGVRMVAVQSSAPNRTSSSSSNGVRVTGPTADICFGEFQPLTAPIFIREGDDNDFSPAAGTTQTFTLGLDNVGIIFNTNKLLTITAPASSDLSNISYVFLGNSVLRLTYNVNGTSSRDFIRIEGLEVQAETTGITSNFVRIGGTASQTGNSELDNIIHGTFNAVTSSVVADFQFDPNESTVSSEAEIISLNPDVSLILGTNIFSGPSVNGNETDGFFFTPDSLNIGTNDITLLHTDQFGCVATATKTITVFDANNSIDGLSDKLCATIGIQSADSTETILGNAKQGFTLIDLSVNTTDIDNPAFIDSEVLRQVGSNWVFDINRAGRDLSMVKPGIFLDTLVVDSVALEFVGLYRNNFDASDIQEFRQVVSIAPPPQVLLFSGSAVMPRNEYCLDEETIPLRGARIAEDHPNGSFRFNIAQNNNNSLTDNADGTADIDPRVLGMGRYNIVFEFTNLNTTCSNSDTISLAVQPVPVANFLSPSGCVDSTFQFTSTSGINNSVVDTARIASFIWDFDDIDNVTPENPNNSTEENPSHVYASDGTYNVSLSVRSNAGCISAPQSRAIIIGNNPIVSFTYENIGIGSETNFVADVSNIVVSDNPLTNEFAGVIWNFDGMDQALTTNTDFNFEFPSIGVHDVTLTAVTDKNCRGSIQDSLFIVPVETVTNMDNYTADFSNDDGNGWIGWGINSSWGLGTAGGNVINEGFEGNSDQFWVTGVNSKYNENEESFLYSPIFDLSALERPLIIMNSFNHIFPENDGAVLQYSISGLFGEWKILGEIGSGIEWYNQDNIQNAPGDQVRDLLGWSAADSLWRESRHAVNDETGNLNSSAIQFRVAFKSGLFPASEDEFDGFAIDNFFIGERTRTVLIENFTNTNPSNGTTLAESDFLRNLLNTTGDAVEYVNINYHTDFPGPDPINSVNRADPSARAVYYNISETPRAVIDGTIFQDDPFSDWGENELQLRSLSSAPYTININPSQGANGILDVEVQVTPNSVEGENILIYAAILEKQITLPELTERGLNVSQINTGESVFDFTLRAMLPNAAGLALSTEGFAENVPLDAINFSWPYSLISLDDIAVAVFIQDEESREVYQAEIVDVTDILSPVTGIDDLLNNNVIVFPNPANDKVTVSFGENINKPASVRVYNNFGQLILSQDINLGANKVEIDTKDYTAGIYHIQLSIGDDQSEIKRLMIMH